MVTYKKTSLQNWHKYCHVILDNKTIEFDSLIRGNKEIPNYGGDNVKNG